MQSSELVCTIEELIFKPITAWLSYSMCQGLGFVCLRWLFRFSVIIYVHHLFIILFSWAFDAAKHYEIMFLVPEKDVEKVPDVIKKVEGKWAMHTSGISGIYGRDKSNRVGRYSVLEDLLLP